MKNPSRKWKLFHLSSREAGRACVLLFTLFLFTITGCDNGGDDTPSPPLADTTLHTPDDLAAFKQVLTNIPDDNITGISSDGGLVLFKLNWQLTDANWKGILAALETEGRYVSLDLTGCTKGSHSEGTGLRTDGTFAPNGAPTETALASAETSPGKTMIVELVLPDQATKILEGSSKGGAFLYFLSLAKITGRNITEIGNNAFYMDPGGATPNLKEANFPKVIILGNSAFSYCYSLPGVSFPEATTLGNSVFSSCITLNSVSLPKAHTLGNSVFASCFELTSIDLPEAATIGNTVFTLCEKLASVNLPEITAINPGAYNATTGIPGGGVFTGCTTLVTLNIPKIQTLGAQAFTLCENSAPLVITMGAAAPAVGENLFLNVNSPRTVTIKRPAPSTGNGGYTDDWKINFTGRGWDGTQVSQITNPNVAAPNNNTQITVGVINL